MRRDRKQGRWRDGDRIRFLSLDRFFYYLCDDFDAFVGKMNEKNERNVLSTSLGI